MDNNDIKQLIVLKSERFFQHIEEHDEKLVEKILRYHDIDSYTILSQVDQQAMINLFEIPNDENCTNELIDLKKEICNICQDSITLKFGTKHKIILLSSSSSSSSSYNSASDCEASFEHDRTKLYLRNRRFQLSNFVKHLNVIKNVSTSFTNNSSEEPDDRATDLHQTDSNDQILRTETNQSINKNDSNICANSDNINKSTVASSKIK
ncbi:unnamed protein product [Rotaria socialis]|nr:unnamed protein product [Rotaria socialis]